MPSVLEFVTVSLTLISRADHTLAPASEGPYIVSLLSWTCGFWALKDGLFLNAAGLGKIFVGGRGEGKSGGEMNSEG